MINCYCYTNKDFFNTFLKNFNLQKCYNYKSNFLYNTLKSKIINQIIIII